MRISLLIVLLLALRALPDSQPSAPLPVPGPAVRTAAVQGKVYVGDGIHSHGSVNGTSHVVFQNALDALGSNGGVIEVLPGTYTFGSTVTISDPGIRIHGARQATIRAAGSTPSGPALIVNALAAGFALDGITLSEERGNGEHLVEIHALEASVTHCAFLVQSATSGVTAHALHLTSDRAVVEGNSFLFGSAASGRVGLGAVGSKNLRVTANEFRAANLSMPSAIQGAIVLEDVTGALIEANTFLALASPTAASPSNATLVGRESAGSLARIAVAGNVFGEVSGASILSLHGDGEFAVSGNVFGRDAAPLGVVRFSGGAGSSVTGNQFHDDGATGEACVNAAGLTSLLVSANTFLDCRVPQVLLAAVDGATVLGNRFTQASGPIAHAVELDIACARVFIGGNALRGGDWDAVYSPSAAVVEDFHNYNR